MNTHAIPDSREVVVEAASGRQAEFGTFAREAERLQRVDGLIALERTYARFERGELRLPTFADPDPWEAPGRVDAPAYAPILDSSADPRRDPYVEAGDAWRFAAGKLRADATWPAEHAAAMATVDAYFAGPATGAFAETARAVAIIGHDALERADARGILLRLAVRGIARYFGAAI